MGCKFSVPSSMEQQLRLSADEGHGAAASSGSSASAAGAGNHALRETEHRLEVAFRTKRQNVFSSGVGKELGDPSYRVKVVPKAESEKALIRT